jgi:hypothetical protein
VVISQDPPPTVRASEKWKPVFASRSFGSEPTMVEEEDKAPSPSFQDHPGSVPALAFAAGAVALWSTNALVGKSLLASHPVSLVQFLQFSGAAFVFAFIWSMNRKGASRKASSARWSCNMSLSPRCR